MLLPSIFGESLLDEFFDHPHQRSHYQSHVPEMMRTDIKDLGNAYEMTMNLPGIKKENVKAELKDGYLTISASSASQNEEKDSDGVYIRRERYAGTLGVFFSMLVLSRPLTLITVVMVICMVFATKIISSKSGYYFVKQQTDVGNLNGYIEEMMEGQKVVKVFCHEDACIQDFKCLRL